MRPESWRTVAIAEAVVIVAAGIVAGVLLFRSARPTANVGPSPASTPVATAPAPNAAALEALTALMNLRSVLSAGVTYGDYVRHVGEMKIHVDRYLEGATGAGPEAAGDAAGFYILATRWKANYEDVDVHPLTVQIYIAMESCPAFGAHVRARQASRRHTHVDESADVAFGERMLWACASARIDELDRILAAPRSK